MSASLFLSFIESQIGKWRLASEWWQSMPSNYYKDGTTIDWSRERAIERRRIAYTDSLAKSSALLVRGLDTAFLWLIIVIIGLSTGLVSVLMRIVGEWLEDVRHGVCQGTWWLPHSACCTGDSCSQWISWNDIVTGGSPSLLWTYTIEVATACMYSVVAGVLVCSFSEFSAQNGIPEVKVIMEGSVMQGFMSGWTLLIKVLAMPLVMSAGLVLGQEGPLVHVACCICMCAIYAVRSVFGYRLSELRLRQLLTACMAAGMSAAFGAPIGGILCAMEWSVSLSPSTLWRVFVCAMLASSVLPSYSTILHSTLSQEALFSVTSLQYWNTFEVVPWILFGLGGGVVGALFVKLNAAWERIRKHSPLVDHPIQEIVLITLFTVSVSYLVDLSRVPTSLLVSKLFHGCSPEETSPLPHPSELSMHSPPVTDILCSASRNLSSIVLDLVTTGLVKFLLAAVTFGTIVPAGIFLPSLATGACLGYAAGAAFESLHQIHPNLVLFASCAASDATVACINPPVYAAIGAASVLAGTTRLTASIVVIMFELTGSVDLVLQVMLTVMLAKFVGDSLHKESIFDSWILFRQASRDPVDPLDALHVQKHLHSSVSHVATPLTAADVLTRDASVSWTAARITSFLAMHPNAQLFPIVDSIDRMGPIGLVSRSDITTLTNGADPNALCIFESAADASSHASTPPKSYKIPIPYSSAVSVPRALPVSHAVHMLNVVGLACVLVTGRGHLDAILFKDDLSRLLAHSD